jgi:hypothetical protein
MIPPPPQVATVDAPLIDDDSSTHHFGAVVGKSNPKLKHEYRLVNTTNHDINIVELINRKPCCGELQLGKSLLHPGDETAVEVTLSVKQEFGDIVHETVVLTDPPQSDELVLRTSARAYPAIRVEEVGPANGSTLLTSDEPRRVRLRVFAYGSSAEPSLDLNRVQPRSSVKVAWEGLKETSSGEVGLNVESRRLIAVLDPAAKVGERKDEILLLHGDQVLYKHTLSWEVVPPITSSPKTVVLKTGNGRFRVVVQSRDKSAFRITRIECSVAGVQGTTGDRTPSLTQLVQLLGGGVRRVGNGTGVITIFTDHPVQKTLDLQLVVLE